jgi:hypothetical protein
LAPRTEETFEARRRQERQTFKGEPLLRELKRVAADAPVAALEGREGLDWEPRGGELPQHPEWGGALGEPAGEVPWASLPGSAALRALKGESLDWDLEGRGLGTRPEGGSRASRGRCLALRGRGRIPSCSTVFSYLGAGEVPPPRGASPDCPVRTVLLGLSRKDNPMAIIVFPRPHEPSESSQSAQC